MDGPCMLVKEAFCEVGEGTMKVNFFFSSFLRTCLPGNLATALAVSISPTVNIFH